MKFFPLLLLLACSLSGQKAPSISQHQLDAITSKWLVRLRLTDWDVRAHLVTLEELADGTLGDAHISSLSRSVRIQILRPEDYEKAATQNGTVPKRGKEIQRDIEDTVVHELVHLRLRDLMVAEVADLRTVEEVTVNRLTSAFLEIKGAGR